MRFYKQFNCKRCNVPFERYVPPSSKFQERLYCGRSCQMKAHFKTSDAGTKQFVCEFCSKPFERYVKTNSKARFCTKKCASKHHVQLGLSCFSSSKQLVRAGREGMANKLKQIRSNAAVQSNTGRRLSEETKRKISKSCTGIPNKLKGKTFVEFYGVDRAEHLSSSHSQKLKDGFASGKIKPTARSGSAPIFRGVKLRSKLEQHAIEFLEKRDGLTFGQTLMYEDVRTYVEWKDTVGCTHTYIPDLFDTVNNIVYEIKPAWKVDKPTDEQRRKFAALKAAFPLARYLTDHDMKEENNAA